MPDRSLRDRIVDFIRRPECEAFDALALEVFAYQYVNNAPYRAFCDRRGAAPGRIGHWRQIPAVPTGAFKSADLTCRPRQPSNYFLTSGTTQGADRRGRHLVADLSLYHAAAVAHAERCLFAGVGADLIRILSLTPPTTARPHSSLIHMIALFMERWGDPRSGYFAMDAGLDVTGLTSALRQAEADGRPVAVLTTTAALALFLDHCEQHDLSYRLPVGSRLMETGGNKWPDGLARPPHRLIEERAARLDGCRRRLGLPDAAIVNEYGMTELCSQFYDDGGGMTAPHWVRSRLIDPRADQDVPADAPGLLCHYDLANLHSVMAVQTDDIGIRLHGDGSRFRLLGRGDDAEPRGCSLDPAGAQLLSASPT